jgi:hypothetical protein
MHLLGPGAIRPDKSWVFFTKETKKKREREEIDPSTDVWERGDLQFEPVQCKWRAGYTKNAGGASRGDETRA